MGGEGTRGALFGETLFLGKPENPERKRKQMIEHDEPKGRKSKGRKGSGKSCQQRCGRRTIGRASGKEYLGKKGDVKHMLEEKGRDLKDEFHGGRWDVRAFGNEKRRTSRGGP